MPKQVFLKVFANGFCAEPDHENRVHGHLQYEPNNDSDHDAVLSYVGCHLVSTPKAKGWAEKPKPGTQLHHVVSSGHADAADHDHVWEYDTEPTLVPLTPYYLAALRQHGHHGPALLPADETTHMLVHGTRDTFRAPHVRLHQYSRERALIPTLRHPAEGPVVDAHLAHLARRQKNQELPERDHEAEWHAFVGPEVHAKRLAWEASEPTHANFHGKPAVDSRDHDHAGEDA